MPCLLYLFIRMRNRLPKEMLIYSPRRLLGERLMR